MPTVIRENISPLNDKITVTVNREDYFPSFEKSLKNYAKTANIPGFRKGMVPAGMVRKMHGSAVFTEEVLRSVEKGLTEYLRKENLDIFAQPLPSADNDVKDFNMNEPTDYSFAFEIGLKPGFELADLAKAPVTRYQVTITEEMIQEELARMQQKFGKMSEPETVTAEDNVVNVLFEASDAAGIVAEGAPSKENSLLVKYFAEDFRKKLMGSKKDDSLVLQLSTAFDEKEREWLVSDLGLDKADPAAIDTYFKMTITKVGHIEKRELDEAFFKEVYPTKEIKTETEFREEIKKEIGQYWDAQSRNHLQHALYHILTEQTKMDFPENFLRRWMLEGGDKPKTESEVDAEFPTFRNQLRWTLVSDKIVNEQTLEVSREEIVHQMKQQVMSYFGSMSLDGNLDWLDGYIDRMMKDEQQVDGAYRRIITEKIFNWAETQVVPEVKAISVDDFTRLMKEHEHIH